MEEFDYVIVGGGSAGCVLAAGSARIPTVTVCLLEAGGAGDKWVVNAPLGTAMMVPTQDQQLGLRDRAAAGPQRPARLPAARQGARRLERDQRDGLHPRPPLATTTTGRRSATPAGPTPTCCPTSSARRTTRRGADACHGSGGPLNVADLRSPRPVRPMLRRGGGELQFRAQRRLQRRGAGRRRPLPGDADATASAGARRAPICIPHPARPNLTVVTEAQATRIVFEGKRATGVEYRVGERSRRSRGATARSSSAAARSSRRSCCMLSGIGDRRRAAEARHRRRARPGRRRAQPAATTSISSWPTSRRRRTCSASRSRGMVSVCEGHRALRAASGAA